MEDKYIVALEIGSSKIKGAIGLVDASGALSVKTVEEERLSDSVRYGCIRNILETTTAIRNVINRLEQREPQRKITGVYISVGGRSLMSQDIEVERILPSEMEITNELIVDITTEALSQQLHERTIVGVSPKEFRVDNLPTKSVVGTYGSRITARLNLISCRTILMRNLNVVLDDRLHLTINDGAVDQRIFNRLTCDVTYDLFGDYGFGREMLLDVDALGGERASADAQIHPFELVGSLALFETADDVAHGLSCLHDVAYASIAHDVAYGFLFYGFDIEGAVRAHRAGGSFYLGAAYFKSDYKFFFHIAGCINFL